MRLASTALSLCLLAGGLQGCVPVIVGGAAAGAAVAHDRRTAASVLADEQIELKIFDYLNSRHEIFAEDAHVNYVSYNQIVLLSGEVPSRELGLQVADFVRSVDKVRQVHNELVIGAPASLASRANDTMITTGAKAMLVKVDLPAFDPTRVKVVTESGTVYLMGMLTREEAEKVTEQVRRVRGVRMVVQMFELLD